MKFDISHILPSSDILNTNGYFRYVGSLTTPPCTEGISWTIFDTKLSISHSQVNKQTKKQKYFE